MKFIKTLKHLKKNKPRIKKINKIKLWRQNWTKILLAMKKLNQLLKKRMKFIKNLKKFLYK